MLFMIVISATFLLYGQLVFVRKTEERNDRNRCI